MSDFGRTSGQGGRLGRAIGLLSTWIRAATDRLFQEDDERARQHCWQVEVRRGGFIRVYRDPRFDGLQGCPICRGAGIGQDDLACGHCSGTGRITLDEQLGLSAGVGR
jgi:hypothetical protein